MLDGSERVDNVVKKGLSWDVMGGVARRNWARNKNAIETAARWNEKNKNYVYALTARTDDQFLVTYFLVDFKPNGEMSGEYPGCPLCIEDDYDTAEEIFNALEV